MQSIFIPSIWSSFNRFPTIDDLFNKTESSTVKSLHQQKPFTSSNLCIFKLKRKILIQHKNWSSKLSVKSYSIPRNKGRKENFLLFVEKRRNSYFLKFVPSYWKNSINISDIYFLNVFSHKVYKKYKMGKIEQQRERKKVWFIICFSEG